MKNEKKQKLGEIKVQSFVTTLNREEQTAVKGGSADPNPYPGTDPIICQHQNPADGNSKKWAGLDKRDAKSPGPA